MADTSKPTIVDVLIYRGKDTWTGITRPGKVYGGIVTGFPEIDPKSPVVWLGGKSYTTLNLRNKRSMLYYDMLSKTLFKPSQMGTGDDSMDMLTQTTANVLTSGKESQEALGIQTTMNMAFKYGLAIIILFTILAIVGFYLISGNIHPAAQAASNAVTTTIAPAGPQIIPANGT